MTDTLTPVLTANWDQPDSFTLEGYSRTGGYKALRKTLAAGREFGSLGALVSGSGPTCLFLARSARHATDLAVALSGAGVCRSVVRAAGPAAGATVISPRVP